MDDNNIKKKSSLIRFQRNELMNVFNDSGEFRYYTFKDQWFLPYLFLEEDQIKTLPVPFLLLNIHPENKVGFDSDEADDYTNIIALKPDYFNSLSKNMRDNIRNIKAKNHEVKLVYGKTEDLDNASKWHVSKWTDETKELLDERIDVWKKMCTTLSAYHNDELIGVHITVEDNNEIHYLGCFWDPKYKASSIATYLLYSDIKNAMDKGYRYYDLGVGDEVYKKRWNVIERKTKYFALMTKEYAAKLDVKECVVPKTD